MAKRITKRAAHEARMAAVYAEAEAVVATGKCPACGAGIHRNTALTGWLQCDRSGSGHFRRDQTGAACSWQAFTRN